jgi:hypothetical protein
MKVQTERLGVTKADFFFSSVGWLFREQTIHDYGVDAHVEIVNEGYPTGALIAIQVKSGESFFNEEIEDAVIFRTDEKHINYWKSHALPVILVLYSPATDELYWVAISDESTTQTGKGWRVEVPKSNLLEANSCRELAELVQPEKYIQKLSKLRIDKYWIQKLYEGEEVHVSFDDWINKSLKRYEIRLFCESDSEVWPMVYAPDMGIEEALAHFLPWADFEMDIESHREGSESQWNAECYMMYDKEEGKAIYSQSFEEWYGTPEQIVPCYEDGEIATYSLRLSLNDIGQAFMELDGYLEEDDRFLGQTFSIDQIR